MIWKQTATPEAANQINAGTLGEALGIVCTAVGDDYIEAKMPVDSRTVQPYRFLHGGASVALAETLGSMASNACIEDLSQQMPVGVEINANHLRTVKEGAWVTGGVMPVKVGRTMHVWNIEIRDEAGRLVCVSRLTVAVVAKK